MAELQYLIVLDLVHFLFHRAGNLSHRIQRDGVESLLDAEKQRFDDGQGQRQPETECRSPPYFSLNLNRALEPLENALYHIQPDSSTRQFRDLLGRTEARTEDEVHGVGVGETAGIFL